jgi:two-component system, chemotaxis family, chemotaxis protein CheY
MSKRILMTDDSSTLRMMMKEPLVAAGYIVDEAEDGLQGLEMLQQATYDLLITDLNMPRMNGLELIINMREKLSEYKFLPVLMLTTEMGVTLKETAKNYGVTAWMTKPFSPEKLLTIVQKVLR